VLAVNNHNRTRQSYWVAMQPGANEAILTTHIVGGPWSRSFLWARRLRPDFQFGRVRGALDIGDGKVERPFRLLEQLGINRPRLEGYTLTQPISQDAKRGDSGIRLVIRGNEVPRRAFCRRFRHHVFNCPLVIRSARAIAEILI